MAVVEILARDHIFKASTTNSNFITISGINNWSWSEDAGTANARHFDDGGHNANLVVSRGITVTLEGLKQVDPATGSRDAGQALVDGSMSGSKFGSARFLYYRIAMHDGTDNQIEIGHVVVKGSAKPAEMGGENDDLMPWGVEVEVYGRPIAASGVYADLY